MPDPTDVTELHCLLGMVNFLGQYVKDLSTTLQPVTEMMEKDRAWTRGPSQANAMAKVKKMLISAATLACFDQKTTTVSADARSYGECQTIQRLYSKKSTHKTLWKSERRAHSLRKDQDHKEN